ncbi:MAG: flavin reductase family protein [Bacteroidota bacterium]|nr:flavin reductase family protein [Bacteroidota bacterium]MCA6443389.1 flavin reductase family protein [Bacteroidota bacterium]
MLSINPKELTVQVVQKYLQNAIAPRPICFASTISKSGEVNLAPFSFFNIFSSNPPIAVFSPAYSGRTGAPKDTLLNVLEVPECVINVVNYNMVYQMSLASSPFAKGINEFEKAGFTQVPSDLIQPPRVKESPVQFECKVIEVKELGKQGGAGNLIICEIIKIHIDESVLKADKQIDTHKIDLVARMGDNWYCRASGAALFEVEKPITSIGIGYDAIPVNIKNSSILTGNNLGLLGSVEQLPTPEEIAAFKKSIPKFNSDKEQHLFAQSFLELNKVKEAWMVLLD